MGRVLLCTGRYAENPYYLQSLGVNIFCVEELCFLFASNPFMIGQEVMDIKLVKWLDQECGLGDLCHQLLNLLNRGCQPGTFAGTVMKYVNYNTPEEIGQIDRVLQENVGLNDFERQKKQADFLLGNRRYQPALEEYDRLCKRLPETESALRPAIYHNMGVAYTGTFLFDMAAKYFRRAYEMTGDERSGLQFLAALRLSLEEDAYIAFIAEHGEYHGLSLKVEKLLKEAGEEFEASEVNRMLTALKIYKNEGNAASYYEQIDKIISEQKDEYRELVSP